MNEPSQDPYEAPPPVKDVKKPGEISRAGTRITELLIVLGIIAILIAVIINLIPTRGDHPHIHCMNNLRNIGLALHQYQSDYGSLPPAYLCDDQGVPVHSWRVLILPYLDEQDLYDQYRFDEPWNGPHNIQLQDAMPDCYRCPAYHRHVEYNSPEETQLRRLTNYAVVVSSDSLFDGSNAADLGLVEGGLGDAVMAAEVRQHAVHWMSPVDVTPEQLLTDLRRTVNEKNANHPEVLNIQFGDGSVRTVSHDTPQDEFDAMITVADEIEEDPVESQ